MHKNIIIFFIAFVSLVSFKIHAEQLFMVVTPEKTGTHLLTKAITMLTNKEVRNNWGHRLSKAELFNELQIAKQHNQYLQMHARPTPEIISTLQENGYKVIFLMRDPRDVAISLFYAIEHGWAYGTLCRGRGYMKLSPEDKIAEIITGKIYRFQALGEIIVSRLPWMQQRPGFVYTARFENLVGPQGGGNADLQMMELVNISNHIGLEVNTPQLESIAENLYGKPGEKTFREGKIGCWRTHFSPQNKTYCKIACGQLLIYLGYEKDLSW